MKKLLRKKGINYKFLYRHIVTMYIILGVTIASEMLPQTK
jgi:hypothetical protein